MGAPRARALVAAYLKYALTHPSVGTPPFARRPAKSRDICTFLSSLGENGFFSNLLRVHGQEQRLLAGPVDQAAYPACPPCWGEARMISTNCFRILAVNPQIVWPPWS